MNIEELRDYCLSLPGVEETFPFGSDTLVYKVNGKIFLLSGLDAVNFGFNVKCDPDLALELREQYACVKPGYHMNKKHWNTITPDHIVADKQLREWINHSYQLVANPSKKKKKN